MKEFKAFIKRDNVFSQKKLICLLIANLFIVFGITSVISCCIVELKQMNIALIICLLIATIGDCIIYTKYKDRLNKNKGAK